MIPGTGLDIVVDATEQALPGVEKAIVSYGRITSVGGLPDATARGLASVAVVIEMPDGQIAVGETTLALMHNAMRVLAARYPDPRP